MSSVPKGELLPPPVASAPPLPSAILSIKVLPLMFTVVAAVAIAPPLPGSRSARSAFAVFSTNMLPVTFNVVRVRLAIAPPKPAVLPKKRQPVTEVMPALAIAPPLSG